MLEARNLDDMYSGIYEDGKLLRVNAETTDADFFIDKINALIAERDRLAAENAELRYWKQGNIRCAAQLAAANATLDALREAIRRQHAELFYMTAAQYLSVGFDAKKETDNG